MRAALICLFVIVATYSVQAHSWYPPRCCSGHDCRPIHPDDVTLTKEGYLIRENGQIIPYDSPKVMRTPPEGGGRYHRCSVGGTPGGSTICLFIPYWGS